MLFCWFDFLVYEGSKEIIWKEERKRRKLSYFDFIAGFNNHSVGEEIIPESK